MKQSGSPLPHVVILGSRGIPNKVGGFETFAEVLALHLVASGWRVTVMSQSESGWSKSESAWRGIEIVEVPSLLPEPLGALLYDCRSIWHAVRSADLILSLGYNTGFLCVLTRIMGVPNIVNMDGIEYRREKWPKPIKAWFWVNERIAATQADHLIADNPGIYDHLARARIGKGMTMIAYGSERVDHAPVQPVEERGLATGKYLSLVARLEPENSILQIVEAYSAAPREHPLVVVGPFDPDSNHYHSALAAAASTDVRFIGAIYDRGVVQSLRFHSLLYLHGHRVGGTNPSLVEALGTGSAIVAHDNVYNRWVIGEAGEYFRDADDCMRIIDALLGDDAKIRKMKVSSRDRHSTAFTWDPHLSAYDRLLRSELPSA